MPEEYERKYSHVKERNRARILGMVSLLDDSVGRLVDKLVSKSLIDNTLIVFSSDVRRKKKTIPQKANEK